VKPRAFNRRSGLTFVEILVAAAVGAVIIAAAVVGFGTFGLGSARTQFNQVELPAEAQQTFYGSAQPYITVGGNPNFFEAARARQMAEKLSADTAAASAVFVLGREGLGGVRPESIPVAAGTDLREISSPAAFRDFMAIALPSSAGVFDGDDQAGALTAPNASIFVIEALPNPSLQANQLNILAVYEVDFVETSSPDGTFASVRRYAQGEPVPTHEYFVFYPGDDNGEGGFRPLGAFFGRRDLATEGSPDPYMLAPNRPFSFAWWPDPLVPYLSNTSAPGAADAPRGDYANMAGRTSLFFVLPTFPGL